MEIFFLKIYDFFKTRTRLFWISLCVICLLLALATSQIRFETNVQKMMPQSAKIEAMSQFVNNSNAGEQIILSIKDNDTTADAYQLIHYQQQFAAIIEHFDSSNIEKIVSQTESTSEQNLIAIAHNYTPLYLSEQELNRLDTLTSEQNISEYFEKQKQLLQTPAGAFLAQLLPDDPLGINALALSKFANLNDTTYTLIDNYIFTNDEINLLFFLKLRANASIQNLETNLQKSIDSIKSIAPQLEVTYFGGALVASANAQQMQTDTIVTLSITILLLLALVWSVFKRKRATLILMLPVLFGMLFSLGIMTIIQGNISVMALGAGAVIFGIALDFSIHFMSHHRQSGNTRADVAALSNPLSLGAFTTIGAFLILQFAHAPILQDLGLFAGLGLAGASLFTLVFLPHILDRYPIHIVQNATQKKHFLDRFATYQPEKSKWLLLLIFICTPVFWYFSNQVQFNGDLMQLNYMSPALEKAESELNKQTSLNARNIFVIATGASENDALAKLEIVNPILNTLSASKTIRTASNPTLFFPSEQTKASKKAIWEKYWTPEKIAQTQTNINTAAAKQGLDASIFANFSENILQKSYDYNAEDEAFIKQMMPINFSKNNDAFAAIINIKASTDERENIINAFKNQSEVVVTDKQSISETLLDYLNIDFNNLLFYSGLLVFIALLIVYGRIELAVIAFLPMAISWIWILGIMAIFGLEFNIVNIVICTLIFGLGDDYSIFMLDGLMEKYRTGKEKVIQSRGAIYLSAITTIIGLGTLIFAQHPALKSIALTAVLGIICVVFIAQVLQPFLFNLLIQKRANKGLMPFTFWSLAKSIFAFTYFVVGCIVLTIVGIILRIIRPLAKDKIQYCFHYLLSKYTKSLLYIMGNLAKKFYYSDTNYAKDPAIYIANHTSFLDILILTALHPKMILVTAKWVWNSPVMGKVVKMAEYYPVEEGAVEGLDKLKAKVDKGYSIMIFPEGTRSKTDTILKFKKGAFFLAEQLHLPIQPVIIHGAQYNMPKNDFLLKDGTLDVYVLPKIDQMNGEWGQSLNERRKKISHWLKNEYQLIKVKNEHPKYFKDQLINGYIYKGPVLEWYCRIKTKLENYYEHYHNLLPREGKIYDLGCGYGFMTYLLHWSATGRQFVSYDYDEDKIETAQHHYFLNSLNYKELESKTKAEGSFVAPLNFQTADLTKVTLEPCNAIMLMDALHYLEPEEQWILLDKCAEALLPNGVLLLRDGVVEMQEKHENTLKTERLSTKIFKFNKTQNDLHFISQEAIINWCGSRNLSVAMHNYSKSLSNVTFVIRKGEM